MSEIDENCNDHPFADAPVIFKYTRAQAIEDGVLIDVSETAREAGIKYPVAITVGVLSEVVRTPEIAARYGESDSGRLWDCLWLLSLAIRKKNASRDPREREDTVTFSVIATDQRGEKPVHHLWCSCGPGDNADPVLTVMLRSED